MSCLERDHCRALAGTTPAAAHTTRPVDVAFRAGWCGKSTDGALAAPGAAMPSVGLPMLRQPALCDISQELLAGCLLGRHATVLTPC
jgi:hypothetical protein